MESLLSRRVRAGVCRAVCTLSVLAGGCGDKAPKLYPAAGKVVIHGQPAEDFLVVLVPVNRGQEALIRRSTGVTGSDGTFTLVVKKPGDGVPAGEYIVTLTHLGRGRFSLQPRPSRPPPQIDKKYRDTERSPLRVRIEPVPAGETYQIPTIEVP